MTVFTWKIYSLNAITKDESTGLENVIKSINWFYTGEAGGFTHTISGTLNLNDPVDEQFIPWDVLKSDKNIVINWLENLLDMDQLKGNVQTILDMKMKPKEITLYLDEENPA